jgi:small subunit ribosomal protein S17
MNNKPAEKKQEMKGRMISGKVTNVPSEQTVVVAVESFHRHPLYRKAVRRTKKILAHNTGPAVKTGDTVVMREIPPVSKRKHFLIVHEGK